MLYKKPKNTRYVDMAMWIDETFYTDQRDDEKTFIYLYHLSHMLASKAKYFHYEHQIDDFAVYAATETLLRMDSPKIHQLQEDGSPVLLPVKSCLNYLKASLYGLKVEFEQDNYYQLFQAPEKDLEIESSFQRNLESTYQMFQRAEFDLYATEIGRSVSLYLARIPKKRESAEWQNICISCLLSLLRDCTLSEELYKELLQLKEKQQLTSTKIDSVYNRNRRQRIVLYHLPEHFRDYIFVLCKELAHIIAMEVSHRSATFISAEMNAQNIIMSEFFGREEEEN